MLRGQQCWQIFAIAIESQTGSNKVQFCVCVSNSASNKTFDVVLPWNFPLSRMEKMRITLQHCYTCIAYRYGLIRTAWLLPTLRNDRQLTKSMSINIWINCKRREKVDHATPSPRRNNVSSDSAHKFFNQWRHVAFSWICIFQYSWDSHTMPLVKKLWAESLDSRYINPAEEWSGQRTLKAWLRRASFCGIVDQMPRALESATFS